MSKTEHTRCWIPASISGGAAGLLNGFFGGGGGLLLVPLLVSCCKLPYKKALATSVSIILPLCLLSASIYLYYGNLNIIAALPYLSGGLVGGLIGGKLFLRIPLSFGFVKFLLFFCYTVPRGFYFDCMAFRFLCWHPDRDFILL